MSMRVHRPSIEFVDLVINHPDVRPTVQLGSHKLSSRTIMEDPLVLPVAFECGVALFRQFPDSYDGHIFILPSGRGATALAFGKAALSRLAKHVGREMALRTGVPLVLPAARAYCRRLGLKPESRDLFNEYFSTEIQRWAA